MRNAGATVILGVGLMLTLASCGSSTHFTEMWSDPQLSQITLTKVMALAISKEEGLRRIAEDAMVRSMQREKLQVVPAYTLLSQDQVRDSAYAGRVLRSEGFDGVVTMRLIGTDTKTTYVPPSYSYGMVAPYPTYGGFWGYYGYAWPAVYDPGYTMTNQYVRVETNIYSLREGKLVWTGRSETMDPSSVPELVGEIVAEGYAVMEEQKPR